MTLEKFIKKGINAQESVNKILAEAGLPMVEITTEDRLRGAIIEAVGLIEAGKSGKAWVLLKEAMKIRSD